MTVYGITATGFTKPTLAEIVAERTAGFRSRWGEDFDLAPETKDGHEIAISADREFALWELLEALYNALDPDTVTGITQDKVYGINCITRQQASKSLVTAYFEGDALTVIPIGTQLSVLGSSLNIFETTEQVVLVAGADAVHHIHFDAVPGSGSWVITLPSGLSTSSLSYGALYGAVQAAIRAADIALAGVTVTGTYAAGFVITYAGVNGKRPQELPAVTHSLKNGSTSVVVSVETETVGVYQGEALCSALVTGPVAAPAGSLTVINTPISGFDSVYNIEDAEQGTDLETDEAFRVRRRTRVVTSVSATVGAIRSAVLSINDTNPVALIESCFVEENDTMTPTATMNAKSLRVVPYYDGAPITAIENLIAQAIYKSKPGGIELMGAQSGVIIGDDGSLRTIKWDRPTEVPIFITIGARTPTGITADQIIALKTYIANLGNQLGVGEDVLVWGKDSISDWLNNWTGGDLIDYNISVGRSATPTLDDPIVIDDGTNGAVEIATFSTANIIITPTI